MRLNLRALMLGTLGMGTALGAMADTALGWRGPTKQTTGGNQSRPHYRAVRQDHYRDCRGARRVVTILEGHSCSKTYRPHPAEWYERRRAGLIGEARA